MTKSIDYKANHMPNHGGKMNLLSYQYVRNLINQPGNTACSPTHQLVSAGRTNLGIYETDVTYYHRIGMSYSRVPLATKPMRRSTPAHDSQTSHAVAFAGVDAAPQAGATAVTKEIA
ncbi:hypothetical protein EMIT0P4_140041 [Pseudomonas sp. IT-P4]